jgi:hypothetical protein
MLARAGAARPQALADPGQIDFLNDDRNIVGTVAHGISKMCSLLKCLLVTSQAILRT